MAPSKRPKANRTRHEEKKHQDNGPGVSKQSTKKRRRSTSDVNVLAQDNLQDTRSVTKGIPQRAKKRRKPILAKGPDEEGVDDDDDNGIHNDLDKEDAQGSAMGVGSKESPNVLSHSHDGHLSSLTSLPLSGIQAFRKQVSLATVHIITSSKMEQKISSVLKFLNGEGGHGSGDQSVTESAQRQQARLMILTCHEKAVGKLVSIVEIVKTNDNGKEMGESTKAGNEVERGEIGMKKGRRWWQYNKIVPKTIQLKDPMTSDRPQNDTKANADIVTKPTTTIINETVLNPTAHSLQSQENPAFSKDSHLMNTNHAEDHNDDEKEEGGEEDAAFEKMLLPNATSTAHQQTTHSETFKRKPKIRVVPTLAVCLSTVALPSLAEEYGYHLQT